MIFSPKNLKQLSCIGPMTEGLTKIMILFGARLNSTSPPERFVVTDFDRKKDAYKPLNLA